MSLATQFEHDGLTIEVQRKDGEMTLLWKGVSDSRDPGAFVRNVLDDLLDEVRGRALFVDFRPLEYMNSATLSPIMSFIKALDAQATSTVISYDRTVDWQRVNFRCMKAIVRTMRHVTVQEA